ncbi:MAG: epoxyqueuosine reductase [Desulfobacterales bacterium]|jgi:ferredoxin
MNKTTNPAIWIKQAIEDYIEHSPQNTLLNKENDRAFDTPLVGFSKGDDPIWETYKEVVGPFHWTPLEIFNKTFHGLSAKSEDLTVISWILPQTRQTRADNRKQTAYPAERWARARIFGEEVNVKLRKHVVAILQKRGCAAMAPMLSDLWKMEKSAPYVIASTWSERHAAYAAGLGTFGLCDGLITPRGKAMRTGSVIARIQIAPTKRPYSDHHAYCLYYTDGICGKCIARCPVEALSAAGHDKIKCRDYLRPTTQDYVKSHYGFDGYGCGLCQTKVPCESKIPTRKDVE